MLQSQAICQPEASVEIKLWRGLLGCTDSLEEDGPGRLRRYRVAPFPVLVDDAHALPERGVASHGAALREVRQRLLVEFPVAVC